MFCCNSSLPYQSFLTNKNLTWSSWRKMTDKRHYNIASPPIWLITQPIHWYHNFGSSEFACQLECEFIFFWCLFFSLPTLPKIAIRANSVISTSFFINQTNQLSEKFLSQNKEIHQQTISLSVTQSKTHCVNLISSLVLETIAGQILFKCPD